MSSAGGVSVVLVRHLTDCPTWCRAIPDLFAALRTLHHWLAWTLIGPAGASRGAPRCVTMCCAATESSAACRPSRGSRAHSAVGPRPGHQPASLGRPRRSLDDRSGQEPHRLHRRAARQAGVGPHRHVDRHDRARARATSPQARIDIRMDMRSASAGTKDIDDVMLGAASSTPPRQTRRASPAPRSVGAATTTWRRASSRSATSRATLPCRSASRSRTAARRRADSSSSRSGWTTRSAAANGRRPITLPTTSRSTSRSWRRGLEAAALAAGRRAVRRRGAGTERAAAGMARHLWRRSALLSLDPARGHLSAAAPSACRRRGCRALRRLFLDPRRGGRCRCLA